VRRCGDAGDVGTGRRGKVCDGDGLRRSGMLGWGAVERGFRGVEVWGHWEGRGWAGREGQGRGAVLGASMWGVWVCVGVRMRGECTRAGSSLALSARGGMGGA
jgi:hypothetical protein